jgi:ribonuclease PH
LSKSGKICLFQLDGKIQPEKLKEAIDAGKKACREIYELQKKALKGIEEED